jgi:predicted tellurium resistance membrane protein TerC
LEWLIDPQAWLALVTLTFMEIVLGIDNIIFISILTGSLPAQQQGRARTVGLALAMLTRIALLFSLTLILRLTNPWFIVYSVEISGRDLILIIGGLFLIAKSTHEIHDKLEDIEERSNKRRVTSFMSVILQIAVLDIVFSLDSVITAIGMANTLGIMILAIVIAVGFMMFFARSISDFVENHPTVKMLALSFLILIGISLIADGLDQHIPKGYIYFSMAFSVFVEMLNLKLHKMRVAPVKLRKRAKPKRG